uniref:FLYWCH-type domain-containing protein n=1 Tax=Ditylenchus dipsaci TaxID=166011 RepID=A0A915DQ40_9BILA
MNNYSSSDEAGMDGDVSDWSDVSEEAGDLLTQADQEEVAIHPGRPKKQKVTVNPPIPIELIPSRKRMKNGDISFLAILEGEIYKRSEQPNAEGIQQWRCMKHSEGCKMVIDTNRADLCVGKSKTRHSHCTAKVDLDIRAINARVPILATQNQAAPRQIYSTYVPINDVSSAYDAVMTQCARNSDGTEKFVHARETLGLYMQSSGGLMDNLKTAQVYIESKKTAL